MDLDATAEDVCIFFMHVTLRFQLPLRNLEQRTLAVTSQRILGRDICLLPGELISNI